MSKAWASGARGALVPIAAKIPDRGRSRLRSREKSSIMRALVFALQPNLRSWRALVQKHYRLESQKAGVYAAWVPSPEMPYAVCASLGIYRLMKAWIRSDGGIRDRCSEDALFRLCDNRKEELIFAVLSSAVKIA